MKAPRRGAAVGLALAALACGMAVAAADAASDEALETPILSPLGVDHVGMTVPDIEQATAFFERVLGCRHLASAGPYRADDDWLQRHVGVHPRAEIEAMRLLRCAPGANLELFQYRAPEQRRTPPANSDIGGHHLSFYVTDIETAAERLLAAGVDTLAGPFGAAPGDYGGQQVLYFRTPWGSHLELVSYPQGLGYERRTEQRLWDPRAVPAP